MWISGCGYRWPASVFPYQPPTLTATLHNQSPASKSLPAGAQNVDVARISLTASGGDVYLNGIYVATDVVEGLSNFTNIWLYDVTSGSTLLGIYPNQSEHPDLVSFANTVIGNGLFKTYLIRASPTSSAAGNVRIGFSGFSYPTLATPALQGVPIYGNVMTLPGVVATPTPTPSATPTPTPSPSPTPPTSGFTSLAALGLSEGNTISAVDSDDPDVYIVNDWGYKRLFLNPVIFSFYGHLGGFANVKNVTAQTRNVLTTAGLFRNCEVNDPKVYGLEITGEDAGILHWVNTSGTQAVQDDPEFFKKVFCINSQEFNGYTKGSDYASVSQVPSYSR